MTIKGKYLQEITFSQRLRMKITLKVITQLLDYDLLKAVNAYAEKLNFVYRI